MRNLMLFGLIFLLLALNCVAVAPLQLSGDTGKAILEKVASNTTNQTNSTNATLGDLWGWGKVPVGHSVNATGKLITNPVSDDPTVEIPPKSPI